MPKPRMPETSLFPEIVPYTTGAVVDGPHKIYWEACGNPDGQSVVFLHGGPGSGCKPWQRRLYDPDKYHIILFDQRGCGRSTPHLELRANTTEHLVSDMEAIRAELDIDRWIVFGGSWGSTLGVAYADAHPQRVSALVVYGIFMCSQPELESFYYPGGVASQVYPERFEKFISRVPEDRRNDVIEYYRELFTSDDAETRRDALDAWTRWENSVLKLVPDADELTLSMADADYVASHSLIENHYFRHHGFMDKDAVFARIGKKLADVPVYIVSGRYDVICPPITGWQLHKAIKHSRWVIIPDAGHTAQEPGTMRALVDIFKELEA